METAASLREVAAPLWGPYWSLRGGAPSEDVECNSAGSTRVNEFPLTGEQWDGLLAFPLSYSLCLIKTAF